TLGWNGALSQLFRGSRTGIYALNLHQPGSLDLNFNPIARFALAGEGNRPVYISPSSISTTTGAVSSRESRLFDQFSQVSERRSDQRSDSRQLQLGLNFSPPGPFTIIPNVNLNYTYQQARYRANGF